jgi:hypothetical protein
MVDNPYESPHAEVADRPCEPLDERERLRRIAKHQRLVFAAVLFNLGVSLYFFAAARLHLSPNLLLPALLLMALVFQIVAIVPLAKAVSGTPTAVACAILMLIPCVSLFALLIINQQAVMILRREGVKIGFFGVSPKSI